MYKKVRENKDTLQYILSRTDKTNPILFKEKAKYFYALANEILISESTTSNLAFKKIAGKTTNTRSRYV